MPEEFAVDGIRDTLDTDTFFSAIQQDAVASVIVTAYFADEGVGSLSLPWCHLRQRPISSSFNRR